MASPPEQPWTDNEKNQLLAEIIRAAHPQPGVLYEIITRLNIQPRWDEIPLPPGRSLNSCRYAYEGIRRSMRPPVGTTMGPLTPTPMSAPLPALKRPYYEAPYSAGPSGREIRPKPSTSGTPVPQPSPTEPPPKRKRGRPTKAEALAKAEAAASAESISSIIRRAPPVTHGPVISPIRDLKPIAPVTTSGMPIAAMLTPVHGSQKSASPSSSQASSGKRRRARSAKSEPDDGVAAAASGPEPEYESPYARMGGDRGGGSGDGEGPGGGLEDTPARAATALRHPGEDPPSPRRAAPIERPPSAERPTPRPSPPRPS